MKPAPQPVPRGTRRHAWLRVLVLLLALLVPGAHAEAHAGTVAAVSGESTAAECDVLDTVLRPPARDVRRTAVRLRPAPLPAPGPAFATPPATPVPPGTPYALRPPRSGVLRC